ncbi:hypothetical protein HNP77_001101 [Treponema rectale]|uniref:Uncharacterized protein n=1 Tax=Treponema rectale TaxID=744512 RepID=A0A840SH56_9SPIR|nr:hypothetical protein [Treponema rectale]
MVQAEDVFAPEVLEEIKILGERLENEVPYADKATSIMTVEIPVGTEDSIEIKNPFDNEVPQDKEELQRIKDFILSRESLVNNIVSDDSKETYIILSLENYEGGIEYASENIARPALMSCSFCTFTQRCNCSYDCNFSRNRFSSRPKFPYGNHGRLKHDYSSDSFRNGTVCRIFRSLC